MQQDNARIPFPEPGVAVGHRSLSTNRFAVLIDAIDAGSHARAVSDGKTDMEANAPRAVSTSRDWRVGAGQALRDYAQRQPKRSMPPSAAGRRRPDNLIIPDFVKKSQREC
jgi:hypothetical protein